MGLKLDLAFMPRDATESAARPSVAAVADFDPLRFKVRGLRGARSFADRLETALGVDRVRASSATGRTRF
jgi:hypothetical protein